MNLRISISDGAGPALKAKILAMTGSKRADLNRAAGVKVQQITARHIGTLTRNPDSLASKFGAPPSNFYAQASEKVAGDAALNADRSGATLAINSIGFKRAFQAVPIFPKTGKYLAIPINAISYGHRANAEHEHEHGDDDGDDEIGQEKRGIAGVGRAGFGKDEAAREQRAENPAHGIAALPQVDACDSRFRRAEHRRIRVGYGFQEGQAGSHDEERSQEGGKDERLRSVKVGDRHEQERTRNNRQQSGENPRAVSEFPRDPARGQRHEKIGGIPDSLDKCRLGFRDTERILKMFVEHINHAVAKRREQEQRADQHKRQRAIFSVGGGENF